MFRMNLKAFKNVDIVFMTHLINIFLFLIPNIEFFLDLYFLTEVLKIDITPYLKF